LVLPFKRNFTNDPDETGKLRTKEEVKQSLIRELPGIALWALYGAVRVMRNGGYTIPESHRRALLDWKCDVDQVAAFLDECCNVGDGSTAHAQIHSDFKDWCDLNGRKVIGNRKLANRLRLLRVEEENTRDGLRFKLTVMTRGLWGIGKGRRANA
jgi:putative DNA primase/helicase